MFVKLEIAMLELAAWLGDLAGAALLWQVATPHKMPQRRKMQRMQKMPGMLIMLETQTKNSKSYGFNHESPFYHKGQRTNGGGGGATPWGFSIKSAAPP